MLHLPKTLPARIFADHNTSVRKKDNSKDILNVHGRTSKVTFTTCRLKFNPSSSGWSG